MHDGYFDDEGPGEHDAHLFDEAEGENDTVPCPHCRTDLLAVADRCHRCGATFDGEVWLREGAAGMPRVWVVIAVLALLAFLFAVLR